MPDKALEAIFEVLAAVLLKIQVLLSCWLCRLVSTELPNYDASNMLVEANRLRVVQNVRRAYAASYNENPVVTEIPKERSASVFLDCLAPKIAALGFTDTSITFYQSTRRSRTRSYAFSRHLISMSTRPVTSAVYSVYSK